MTGLQVRLALRCKTHLQMLCKPLRGCKSRRPERLLEFCSRLPPSARVLQSKRLAIEQSERYSSCCNWTGKAAAAKPKFDCAGLLDAWQRW